MSETDLNRLDRDEVERGAADGREPEVAERDLRIARYVDDELERGERAAFEAECAADPGLRAAVDEAVQLRGWFGPGREESFSGPGPRFADRVAAAVLADAVRGPQPAADAAAGPRLQDGEVILLARRLAWAAAAVLVVGLAIWSGFLRLPDHGPLEASTQEVRDAMRELDRRSAERLEVTPVDDGAARVDERR